MKIGVVQVCDNLGLGGLEQIVVNIANILPRDRFDSHVCSTRVDGVLTNTLAKDVGRLSLGRKRTIEVRAMAAFLNYVNRHDIRLLHVHGYSVFIGVLMACLKPSLKVVWHDHYGEYINNDRPRWLYWTLARRLNGVISVNRPLVDWATQQLNISPDRVWYLPNFVIEKKVEGAPVSLPGRPGRRIVNVANFRTQKDHHNLVRAMRIVVREVPDAHLLLLGTPNDPAYHQEIMNEISRDDLKNNVTHLGARTDVPAVLKACDVGVLGSYSEGLPVSLIEYGVAGLASVSTDVGQCGDVLDQGKAGLLVPTKDPRRLAEALITFLKSPEKRTEMGRKFRQRAEDVYSPNAVLGQLTKIYDAVIG